MKKCLTVMLTLLIMSLPTPTLAAPASSQSIKQLMQKTGAGDMGLMAMNQMVPALKQMIPDAPEKFWQDFMAEFNADDLEEMIVPIYKKYLSQEEIDAINAFYDTPAGKKLIKVQPLIMQESMAAGQVWGQNVAMDVLKKYQAQQ